MPDHPLSSAVTFSHLPVLAETLMQVLSEQPPSLWQNTAVIDATLGGGGHSKLILERFPGVRLIGLDQDHSARAAAASRLESFLERIQIVPVNFAAFEPQEPVALVLADLGVSSPQLDVASRGFSFRLDGPLDMRMNPEAGGETAAAYGGGGRRGMCLTRILKPP